MDTYTLKQELTSFGINLSECQYERIDMLIRSGKMDSVMIKKLLLPKIPDYLIDQSLDVMNEMVIRL